MYLSRLELHGFKSFATRTVVDFSPGITVVVGPNGCGKSNIVDAVRWVIGEQRARILRSSKMENVIFNGTAKRRPLGMAEVQLTIENTRGVLPTEYTEVTIGRRLYRSGESEYLLNGVPCRLRDITDLFMDTGMGAGAYSVIELKMIDDILSDNAQDRRHLFEEAAGITKYKLRRAQTLRKLEGTQVDLTRLRDLVEELEKRVQGLRRQANKAERYRAQEARLHTLELALAQAEYDRLQEQARHLTAERQRLRDRLEAHQARLARAEADLEALRTRHIEREQVLVARQAALQEHLDALRQLEAERRLEEQRLETIRRDLERLQREQDEAGRRRDTLARTRAKLEAELAAAEPVLREAEARLEAARQARQAAEADAEAARRHRDAARRDEQQAAAAHADLRRRLDRLTARREWLRQEVTTLESREADLANETATHDEQVREAEAARAVAEEAVTRARRALAEAEALHADRAAALEKALEARRQAERCRDAAAAKVHLLDSLLTTHDDLDAPARFLAEHAGWSEGAVRTVADLLACDEAYRPALAAALGPLAACLVVGTVAEAHAARALLREHEQGTATFLVRERLRPVEPLSAPEGARPLAEVVRAARGHEGLARTLLFDTFLVDDLATAERLAGEAAAPARFFTLEGEGVDARGWLQAGSGGRGVMAAGRLGRREQREAAAAALERCETELTAAVDAVAAARQALEAVPLAGARTALATAERTLTEAEKAQARLQAEHEAAVRRHAELVARREALHAELAGIAEEIATLEGETERARRRLEAARAALEDAEEAFRVADAGARTALDRHNDAHVAALEARNRCDNLRRDLERTRAALADLDRRTTEREAERERLHQRRDTLEASLARLEAERTTRQEESTGYEAAVNAAKDALMETKAALSDLEAHLRDVRREREQDLREESQCEVRLAGVQTRTEDLLAHIAEAFGRDLREEPVEVPGDFDEEAARTEVQQLRAALRAMGPVNALALEAYEEENTRLEFLKTQLADLETAEATLLDTIEEINTTASERFRETFEAIRANFTRLFAELFGEEAAADVFLSDPDDPLESPIEITARPRGKRPSTLAQLSGGEKTLTAIALLFAIYLVKPSPFCILDEVDAPLDDANIDRFMKLIRSFADTTQFILVTHNKRTMEAADRMYGITMQEQGVSQLVGVRFDEALELAGS